MSCKLLKGKDGYGGPFLILNKPRVRYALTRTPKRNGLQRRIAS